MSPEEWQAIKLTLALAGTTTLLLILLGTPLAYWLSRSNSLLKTVVSSVVAIPLVLPPTVIGFYLLLAMGPDGPLGKATDYLNIANLAFSFSGLVLGSIVYSLPFVVHPLQNAFESVDRRLLDAAATLGAGPFDRFFSVIAPLARGGFLTALILGFAHTVGEFGVVLMIGGNIPGETQVLSVLLYEQVESFDYASANRLALSLLGFSFLTLFCLLLARQRQRLFLPGASSRNNGQLK